MSTRWQESRVSGVPPAYSFNSAKKRATNCEGEFLVVRDRRLNIYTINLSLKSINKYDHRGFKMSLIYLSIYLPTYIYLSISPSIYLSIYLSIIVYFSFEKGP